MFYFIPRDTVYHNTASIFWEGLLPWTSDPPASVSWVLAISTVLGIKARGPTQMSSLPDEQNPHPDTTQFCCLYFPWLGQAMVVHTCNPNPWEQEVRGLQLWIDPGLQSEEILSLKIERNKNRLCQLTPVPSQHHHGALVCLIQADAYLWHSLQDHLALPADILSQPFHEGLQVPLAEFIIRNQDIGIKYVHIQEDGMAPRP